MHMRIATALVALLLTGGLAACGATSQDAASGSSVPSAAPDGKGETSENIPCAEHPEDEAGLVGVAEETAAERVEADGLVFRVVCRDGLALDGTADARGDRVNAGVQAGVVTFTWRG